MANEKDSWLGIKRKFEAQQLEKEAEDLKNEELKAKNSKITEAEQLNREANMYLVPKKPTEIGAGNEALPQKTTGIEGYRALKIKETLEDPDQVSLDASLSRMELSSDAHCLDMAVDSAESIHAKNSLEKMLAHQMAACHNMAMNLISRVYEEREPVDIQRMVNSSVRLMNTYQQGLRTLHKIRTGGRQEFVVQHVNVEGGGQALVAGKLGKGGSEKNGGVK
jgi:hypothetical protein